MTHPKKHTARISVTTNQDGLLYRNHLLYIPDAACHTRVLQHCHIDPLVGHFGVAKTFELLSRGFWWPQPWKLVKEFIKTCDICVHSKAAHHHPYSLLHPLPLPSRPWASLSMDFIIDLPCLDDHDTVLVIVYQFSKMTHFVPCSKTTSGEERADLFLNNVVQLHGLPEDVTSDRGPQFISHFWRRLLQTFGTSVNLSTTYHPQTDGQTERVNQILEQYLRCTINYQQEDWVDFLVMAEFSYNKVSMPRLRKLWFPPAFQHFHSCDFPQSIGRDACPHMTRSPS